MEEGGVMGANGLAVRATESAIAPANEVRAQHALEPTDMRSALEFSAVIFESGLAPRALRNANAVFAVIARGRELGLTAMQALASIHLVEGKTVMSADLMVAQVRRSGLVASWSVDSTNERCIVTTRRVDDDTATVVSFTVEDAKRAGLLGKDNWAKYPRAMLRARAISEACRMVYPDVMHGCYETDEIQQEPREMREQPRRVETTIIRADVSATVPEKAAPKAPTVDEQEATVTEALQASDLLNQIQAAGDTDELKRTAVEIKKHKFSDKYRVPLLEHWTAKKAELENPEDDGR